VVSFSGTVNLTEGIGRVNIMLQERYNFNNTLYSSRSKKKISKIIYALMDFILKL